jgi:hypothetical protein
MNIQQKLYYKRVENKPILKSGDPSKLDVGDSLHFYGKLYIDQQFLEEVADTQIEYEVLLIKNDGTVLMNTSNEYTFNKLNNLMPTGTLLFEGRVLAHDFRVDNGNVQPYSTEPSVLSLFDSSHNYLYSYGMSDYIINGAGIGEITIRIIIV